MWVAHENRAGCLTGRQDPPFDILIRSEQNTGAPKRNLLRSRKPPKALICPHAPFVDVSSFSLSEKMLVGSLGWIGLRSVDFMCFMMFEKSRKGAYNACTLSTFQLEYRN